MFNPNTNLKCKQPPSILVDKAFGKSYHIVKEVYNNLDLFTEILYDDSLDFIVDNYDELIALKPYIIEVTNNIGDINITASNIGSVITVSSDLKGELISDMSQDLGMIGDSESGDSTIVTGGNIKKVADGIESVREVADEMEKVINVSDTIDALPDYEQKFNTILVNAQAAETNALSNANLSKDWAVKLDGLVDQEDYSAKYYANIAKENADKTSADVDSIISIRDEAVELVKSTGTEQVNLVTLEGSKQITAVQQASADNIINAENSAIENLNTALEAHKVTLTEETNSSINKVIAQETLSITEVNSSKESSIEELMQTKNTIISNISSQEETSISAVKAQETSSIKSLKEETSTQISNITTEGSTQINLCKDQVEIATQKATESANSASSALAQAGIATQKANEALLSANNADESEANALAYKNQAESAKTASELAQQSAESAKDLTQLLKSEVESIKSQIDQIKLNVESLSSSAQTSKQNAENSAIKAEEQATIATNQAQASASSATKAKSEADRAEEAANTATANQLQADWNQTDSAQKDFIKNKPDIYTKSEVDSKLTAVYVYKGTVNTIEELPSSEVEVGWTYNVKKTGANYSWDGTTWDELGATIDLSPYATISSVNSSLATKLDISTYNSDKTTFATKTELSTKADSSYVKEQLATKQPTGDYATNSALSSGLATKLNISDAFTKTTADTLYLGISAKATSAIVADSANSVAWTNVTGKEKVRTTDTPINIKDFGSSVDLGMIGE